MQSMCIGTFNKFYLYCEMYVAFLIGFNRKPDNLSLTKQELTKQGGSSK